MGSNGQISGGWVRVVGYGNEWVEMCRLAVGGFRLWVMAVGGLRCADRWWVMAVGGLRWADRWWVGSGCGLWRWVG